MILELGLRQSTLLIQFSRPAALVLRPTWVRVKNSWVISSKGRDGPGAWRAEWGPLCWKDVSGGTSQRPSQGSDS